MTSMDNGTNGTNMSSLPTEIASLISSSIKHDPIYLLTYVTIDSQYDGDDEELMTGTSELSKLVVLEGTRNEARKHSEISYGEGDSGPLHNIYSKYILPAYLNVSEGREWHIVSTVDYFKPGRTIQARYRDAHHTRVIVSLKRFA